MKLQEKVSDEFENWEQQDQIVLTWLLTSMFPILHTHMVGCDYAFQIWKILEFFFFLPETRAKVSQLKLQLKNVKKNDKINDYLMSIKKIVDTLAAVGSPIDDSEHIQVILDGLSNEYGPIVASILLRPDSYTIPKIEALLMAMEEWIEKPKSTYAFGMQELQANLVQPLQKTWSLVALPPDKNVIGCKWVFRVKYYLDGPLSKHKARLVEKGFHQQEGFWDTPLCPDVLLD